MIVRLGKRCCLPFDNSFFDLLFDEGFVVIVFRDVDLIVNLRRKLLLLRLKMVEGASEGDSGPEVTHA